MVAYFPHVLDSLIPGVLEVFRKLASCPAMVLMVIQCQQNYCSNLLCLSISQIILIVRWHLLLKIAYLGLIY